MKNPAWTLIRIILKTPSICVYRGLIFLRFIKFYCVKSKKDDPGISMKPGGAWYARHCREFVHKNPNIIVMTFFYQAQRRSSHSTRDHRKGSNIVPRKSRDYNSISQVMNNTPPTPQVSKIRGLPISWTPVLGHQVRRRQDKAPAVFQLLLISRQRLSQTWSISDSHEWRWKTRIHHHPT